VSFGSGNQGEVRSFAPGRVNLIGEHTDYTGGLVLPMAIQLGTTITADILDDRIILRSDQMDEPLDLGLPVGDVSAVSPAWGRYVAAVAAELATTRGLDGTVSSDVPLGSGLSSSAALEVATALALGADGTTLEVAQLCQRAEHRASGVPCGIMDQLASAAGVAGHALLIDCHSLDVTPVVVPDEFAIAVVHSGQQRSLASSAYAERRRECERAEVEIGPLRLAALGDWASIGDATVRARARHVITENHRVLGVATALRAGDAAGAGRLLIDGHRSLRDDFAVSTPVLDALVDRLVATPGVWGARLTGAGFGGCAVALCEPGTDLGAAWWVTPSAGARLL
jgi:galactokinase